MLGENRARAHVWGIARREISEQCILTLHRKGPPKSALALDAHGNESQHLPARRALRAPLAQTLISQTRVLQARGEVL